jgi:hypothetical protein
MSARVLALRADRRKRELCPHCGGPATAGKVRCARCRAARVAAQRRRVARKMAAGMCRCGRPRVPHRMSCPACTQSRKAATARYLTGLKAAAIAHYGGRCACCGESTPEFMTFDHVRGGGSAHRAKDPTANRMPLWLKSHRYPKGFRLLCANCNQATANGKPCPHAALRTAATPQPTPLQLAGAGGTR